MKAASSRRSRSAQAIAKMPVHRAACSINGQPLKLRNKFGIETNRPFELGAMLCAPRYFSEEARFPGKTGLGKLEANYYKPPRFDEDFCRTRGKLRSPIFLNSQLSPLVLYNLSLCRIATFSPGLIDASCRRCQTSVRPSCASRFRTRNLQGASQCLDLGAWCCSA